MFVRGSSGPDDLRSPAPVSEGTKAGLERRRRVARKLGFELRSQGILEGSGGGGVQHAGIVGEVVAHDQVDELLNSTGSSVVVISVYPGKTQSSSRRRIDLASGTSPVADSCAA